MQPLGKLLAAEQYYSVWWRFVCPSSVQILKMLVAHVRCPPINHHHNRSNHFAAFSCFSLFFSIYFHFFWLTMLLNDELFNNDLYNDSPNEGKPGQPPNPPDSPEPSESHKNPPDGTGNGAASSNRRRSRSDSDNDEEEARLARRAFMEWEMDAHQIRGTDRALGRHFADASPTLVFFPAILTDFFLAWCSETAHVPFRISACSTGSSW